MTNEVFNRKEIKFVLTNDTYIKLLERLKDKIVKDTYYKSTICNIYFDTDNYDLILKSLDKPIYKEKLRLRSYNIPTNDTFVFLEIKKKYDGIVNKRRIKLKLSDYYNYLKTGEIKGVNKQIKNEIDYVFKTHNLKPKIFIAYDRLCFVDKNNPNFRITFDKNIRSRNDKLYLEYGDYGNKYFNNDEVVMETKTLGSFPLWFTSILSELGIKPTTFSKYGSIYIKRKENCYV